MRIIVYGTLRPDMNRISELAANPGDIQILGQVQVPNMGLWDLGAFPAAQAEPGAVLTGWLLEITEVVLPVFDDIESFHPGDLERSMYWRVPVQYVSETGEVGEAQIYHWNPWQWLADDDRGVTRIPSGDWKLWKGGCGDAKK